MLAKTKTIFESPLIKNTLKLSSSSMILMLIPFLITPILSRLYSPEDYGVWGIFSSVLYIVNSFIFLSYENTIVKSNDDKEIPDLIVLCLTISLSITIIVGLVFTLGKMMGIPFFVNFHSIPLLTSMLFITASYNIFNSIANRTKKYGAMSVSNVINGTSQAAIRVFLGKFPFVSYGLIVGNIISQFIATIYFVFPLRSYIQNYSTSSIKIAKIKLLAKKYKKFPLYEAPARFIEFAVLNLTIIILSNYFGKDEIGYFSMVIQFILLPITVFGSAMGSVYYRELSENLCDPEAVSLITRKVAKITFPISLLPILFLTFGGDKLLVFILGNKWIPAGSMAIIMSVFSVPVILAQSLLPAFKTLDRQEIRFKLNLLNFILAIGALIISAVYFDKINLVLFVYSILYALVQFIIYHKILKITNLRLREVSKYFMGSMLICYVLLLIRIIYSGILIY
ncbi:oligosaccharide flippase family protein [Marinifilum fragile]|uniref:oligosaccharide flippase family protein n=1 Tax=Marinifilum fragile TaxID=570161 RepID=UPI002AA92CF4|nr:oligosaccharide flippase family protein [Marinifilum fragile]